MKTTRILVVGSLVMDLIVEAERFPLPGETVLGRRFGTASGGKGANQAVQAARLGADVTMVGMVGQDAFGDEMLASLRAAGVDTRHILRTAQAPSAVGHIQIEKTKDHVQNRIVVAPGANLCIAPEHVAFLREEIGQYDMVLLQLEIGMEINCLAAGWAAEKGVPVMLNCAPIAPMPAELLKSITYISPNETEAAALAGIAVEDTASVVRAAAAIRAMGVPNVLITLGSRGAAYESGERLLYSPSVKGLEVKDTTAAGDSFIGAFCTAIAGGAEAESALRFANYAAALTVCRVGAQPSLPTLEEVKRLMRERGAL
mgnify:CR=1 FL=1